METARTRLPPIKLAPGVVQLLLQLRITGNQRVQRSEQRIGALAKTLHDGGALPVALRAKRDQNGADLELDSASSIQCIPFAMEGVAAQSVCRGARARR